MKVGDKIHCWTITGQHYVAYGRLKRDKRRILHAVCECGTERKIRAEQIVHAVCAVCTRAGVVAQCDVKTMEVFSRICDSLERITGITRETIVGYERDRVSSYARKVVCHLMRGHDISFNEIGGSIGRTHTSAMRMLQETPLDQSIHRLAQLVDATERRKRYLCEKKIDMPLKTFTVGTSAEYLRIRKELSELTTNKLAMPPVVDERTLFADLCQRLRDMPADNAKKAWKDACQRMWPHTWEKQFRQPPMGLKFGSQEVLAL
jgi:hypothetical protein